MRKTYLAFLAFAFPIAAMAQVTNAENYVDGDQIHNMTCSVPSPGGSGTGQTWNFGGVADSGQVTTYVYDDTSSADPNDIILSPAYMVLTGTQIHKTATQNLQPAIGGVQGVTYTPGLLVAERSFNFGSTDNLPFTSTGIASGGGTVTFECDATGSLTTPTGTYGSAYRVKMVHDEADSIVILLSTVTTHNVSYIWYDNAHRAPLFRIDSTQITGTGTLALLSDTSVTAQYLQALFPADVHSLSATEAAAKANISGNNLTINANLKNGTQYEVNVFNISGQVIYKSAFTATGFVEHFNLNNELAAGTYFVNIYQKSGNVAPIVIKTVKQ